MSYFQVTKRNFFSLKYLTLTTMILGMAFILSGTLAFADPQKKEEAVKPDKKIEKQVEEVEEKLDTIDAYSPMDHQSQMDPPKEQSEEPPVDPLPEPKPDTGDTLETDPVEAVEPEMQAPVMDEPKAETAGYNCYLQDSGVTECICKGEEACSALKEADICEPGTHWGQDEMEGCTQKKE